MGNGKTTEKADGTRPTQSKDSPDPDGEKRGRLVITGISRALGRLLLKRLLGEWDIIGIDSHELDDLHRSHITFRKAELKQRVAEDVFRGGDVDTVIHLAFKDDLRIRSQERHQYNVVGTLKLLDYCERHGVNRVIVLSSANVYGAYPDNPMLLEEDAPLRASEAWSEFRDRVELDSYAQAWMYKNPDIHTLILRPVHVLGPTVTNSFLEYLKLPIVPALLGFNPLIQIIHEEDVVEAIAAATRADCSGVYNVPGPGQLPLREILCEIEAEVLPIPHFMIRYLLRMAWFLGRNPFPEATIDFLRYPCVVNGEKIKKELGYEPANTLRDTLHSLREIRR